MAARKKRKSKKPRSPAQRGVSRSKQFKKRKSSHVKRAATKPRSSKRSTAKRARDTKRTARNKRSASRDRKQTARRGKRIRKTVERSTRPRLKRNKRGGLREYQGPKFGQTKFGGYKEALKRVGEESQHAYDEAVEALREGLEEGLSKATITRRRNKVRRLKK